MIRSEARARSRSTGKPRASGDDPALEPNTLRAEE